MSPSSQNRKLRNRQTRGRGQPLRGHSALTHRPTAVAGAVGLILATTSIQAQNAPSSAPVTTTGTIALKEIIVTAQRRRQTVQQIPYNISVVSGNDLGGAGASNATDLAALVPGLQAVNSGPAARGNTNSFTMRGIRTDNPGSTDMSEETTSPVSTYFGDTPVFFPLVTVDLSRVEVLRGPQGTLYGAGAEAGTIRFMPNQPQFGQFSGYVTASSGKTEGAGSFNNSFSGVVNIPLASKLALRLVAGEQHDAGFITDVGLAERQGTGLLAPPVPRVAGDPTSGFVIAPALRGANSSGQTYGRAELKWDPTERINLELTYLHQATDVADAQYSNPTWPGGQQNLASGYTGPIPPYANASYTVQPGGTYRDTALIQQPYHDKIDLGSLDASFDLGLATLTSTTSDYDNKTAGIFDNTYQWYIPGGTNFLTYYNNYPRAIAVGDQTYQDKSFIQELRLVSNGHHTLDYVAGLYFQRETGNSLQLQYFPGIQQYYSAIGATSANPQLGDMSLDANMNTVFTDRALYGQLTWHITHAWQVTGGARVFSQSFAVNFSEELPFCGAACGNQYGAFSVFNTQSAHKHLFMLNTAYDITPQMKVYATYSEGFRRGGATGLPPVGIYASEPKYFTYSPDFTKNYEVGIKGVVASRLMYTADVFVINFNNFQFDSYSPSGLPAVYNGSTARSKGAELQLTARLTPRTTASFGYSYTDASIISPTDIYDLPAFGGPGSTPVLAVSLPTGTRLPGVPKNSLTASLDYRLPLGSTGWTTVFHIDGMYHSSAEGSIPAVYVSGWTMPSVKMINAKITFDTGHHWSFNIFGTNLTSDPDYSGAVGVQDSPANTLHYRNVARPRTIGLSVRYDFQ